MPVLILQGVACMRNKEEDNDLISLAKFIEFRGHMGSISIT